MIRVDFLPPPDMTDWPTIVSELLASGLTRGELAQRVGAGVSTLNDLRWGNATEPRYALGRQLVLLHAERIQINNENAKSREVKATKKARHKRG